MMYQYCEGLKFKFLTLKSWKTNLLRKTDEKTRKFKLRNFKKYRNVFST